MPLKLETAGLTDVGKKRGHNEDSFFVDDDNKLYVVADGMGGHASGEVASQMAVETVSQFFVETNKDQDKTWPYKMDKAYSFEENRLMVGVKLANKQIFGRAQVDLRLKGMGTTLVTLLFRDGHSYIGHVGDSRVYLIRRGEMVQLTEDHSLLNDYMKIKKLTPEEIKNFPHKNVIVRALGMKDLVQVDMLRREPEAGDMYLLCSDGLSGLVEDPEMLEIVEKHSDDLPMGCQKLVDEANKNGGNDNITVILVKVLSI